MLLASAQPKNFAKENVHRIKEMQKANREKQKESDTSEPVKAVYKPGKFDHVDSKVAQDVKVCILLHFSENNIYIELALHICMAH